MDAIFLLAGVLFVANVVSAAPINFLSSLGDADAKRLATEQQNAQQKYLKQFGYYNPNVDPRAGGSGILIDEDELTSALKKFQKFANLSVTGVLDGETKRLMGGKRCGMSDVTQLSKDGEEGEGPRWKNRRVTWTVDRHSKSTHLSRDGTRRALRDAFAVWQTVIPVDFVEVNPSEAKVDIRVMFDGGKHGDRWPFDGFGGVLAHAMFPTDGRCHFDDDETWVYEDLARAKLYEFTDLLSVAVHELGHNLGLGHSSDPNAVMAPFYRDLTNTDVYGPPLLGADDIRKIQKLYGVRSAESRGATGRTETAPTSSTTSATTTTSSTTTTATTTTTTTTETTPTPVETRTAVPKLPTDLYGGPETRSGGSNRCTSQISAATRALNGKTYVFDFAGLIYELEESSGRLTNGRFVDDLFTSGPRRPTAVVTDERQGLMTLFDGRKFWSYSYNAVWNQFVLEQGFPKELDRSIDFVPNTAFVWKDGNVVLLNGDKFVLYNIFRNGPTFAGRTDVYFPNIPKGTTATFRRSANALFLFTNGNYAVYNMDERALVDAVSQKIDGYLKC